MLQFIYPKIYFQKRANAVQLNVEDKYCNAKVVTDNHILQKKKLKVYIFQIKILNFFSIHLHFYIKKKLIIFYSICIKSLFESYNM